MWNVTVFIAALTVELSTLRTVWITWRRWRVVNDTPAVVLSVVVFIIFMKPLNHALRGVFDHLPAIVTNPLLAWFQSHSALWSSAVGGSTPLRLTPTAKLPNPNHID